MSIFGKIRDAIFGRKEAATAQAKPVQHSAAQTRPTARAAQPAPAAQQTARAAAPAQQQGQPQKPAQQQAQFQQPAQQQVDVEAILNGMAAKSGEKLNWQTSIVDLMKLLGLDSSLSARKELAQELGYTGALDGSAEMNVWLHKRVMRELAANGGKVPPALMD
ncbi:DUF3597 domain-containing protein [Pedomonas mirosovicensis]|uniref:DUF3597 domain-containing protein n=1 Tax=Pedomonas mirosovicensis TaxID=2908641 RepID=UPI002168E6E4|nr:DUF3597 domain-containing protein [Pedomonas mirosovicensis]MCH8685865.1 DUF3597 domain-containing protein [Pedomonas mirosovicensis]